MSTETPENDSLSPALPLLFKRQEAEEALFKHIAEGGNIRPGWKAPNGLILKSATGNAFGMVTLWEDPE